jgi:hypothetical protein
MCIFISLVVAFIGARDFLVGLAGLLVGALREVPGMVLAGVALPRVDFRLVNGLEVSVALPFPLSIVLSLLLPPWPLLPLLVPVVVVRRGFFAAIGLTVGTGGCYESISVYHNVYHNYKNLQLELGNYFHLLPQE